MSLTADRDGFSVSAGLTQAADCPMAKADEHPTPIKELNGALDYLTDELGYTKSVAVYVMDQRYSAGRLRLEKQDLIRDDEPYGDWIAINAEFGHIEPDHHGVRFVPREPLWRKARYRITVAP
jgi:hypothetical protein